MNRTPTAAPATVRTAPKRTPSTRSARLAAHMNPTAAALATAVHPLGGCRTAMNGSAPRPVARHVAVAPRATAPTLTLMREWSPDAGTRCVSAYTDREVAGRSSAWSERRLWEAEAVGSNPTVPTTRLEQPSAAAQDRHRLAVCCDAVHLELVRADHEVGVDRRVVDAAFRPLLGWQLHRPVDRLDD